MSDNMDVSVSSDPAMDDITALDNYIEGVTDSPDAQPAPPVAAPEPAAQPPGVQPPAAAPAQPQPQPGQEPPAPATPAAPAAPAEPFKIQDVQPTDLVDRTKAPELWPQDAAAWSALSDEQKTTYIETSRQMQAQRDRTLQRWGDERDVQLKQHQDATVAALKNILAQTGQPMQQPGMPQQYGAPAQYTPAQLAQLAAQQPPPGLEPEVANYLNQAINPVMQQMAAQQQTIQGLQGQVSNVGEGAFQLAREVGMANARQNIGPMFDQFSDEVRAFCDQNPGVSPRMAFNAVAADEMLQVAYRQGQQQAAGGGDGSQVQPTPPYAAPSQAGRGGETAPSLTDPSVIASQLQKAQMAGSEDEVNLILRELVDAQVAASP